MGNCACPLRTPRSTVPVYRLVRSFFVLTEPRSRGENYISLRAIRVMLSFIAFVVCPPKSLIPSPAIQAREPGANGPHCRPSTRLSRSHASPRLCGSVRQTLLQRTCFYHGFAPWGRVYDISILAGRICGNCRKSMSGQNRNIVDPTPDWQDLTYFASETQTISVSLRTYTQRLANAGCVQTTNRRCDGPVGSSR